MYIQDNIHFTPKGANIFARIIATELKDSNKSKELGENIWLPTYNLNKYMIKVENKVYKKIMGSSLKMLFLWKENHI